MKRLLLELATVAAICTVAAVPSFAQAESTNAAEKIVSQETMKAIYEEVKTPYKVGMVLLPEKGEKIDNPCVFRHGDEWYMIFVVFDGKGYETHLAKSADLVRWKRLGKVFGRAEGACWDSAQADGWPALLDPRWDGPNTLNKFDGRYWMMYIGGHKKGYETDPLSTGVAWTDDPSAVKQWTRYPKNPVFSPSDADARAFERKTIYKHYTVEDPTRACGGRFVDFYNAKQKGVWRETIGMAVSDDMLNWRRVGDVPVISNGNPAKFAISGDPMIRRIGDVWVMFYFGCGWQRSGAFDTFACSYDLKHWTKWEGKLLIEPSEPYDATYAHKPWVIKHNGVVYHFYCAVGNKGRGIALATSQKRDQDRAERYKERLRIIEKDPKENRRTKEQPIKIIGDDEFVKKTEEALALIREKAPKFYVSVTNYIGVIKAGKYSGMRAAENPPTFQVGLTTSRFPLTWYASTIVHDANHSKQYNDYRKNVNKKVPKEIWTGRSAEDACLDVQEAFLKEINAPEYQIKCVQRNKTIDYFSNIKSRDW